MWQVKRPKPGTVAKLNVKSRDNLVLGTRDMLVGAASLLWDPLTFYRSFQ